ncbi:MAG: DUF4115 domain-containing protein [Candidatus Kapabacteria bacterium]|nr:DUF4115 domain-containing protein [Candidatus Kapabacteria bacterium]
MDALNPISIMLREAREERRLSIAELSKLTSIRAHVIVAIEESRFGDLPPVYMKSFVKSYAKSVGISDTDIERMLREHLPASSQRHSQPAPQPQPRSQPTSVPKEHKRSASDVPYQNRNLSHIGTTDAKKRAGIIAMIAGGIGICISVYYLFFMQPTANPDAIQPGSVAPGIVGVQDSGDKKGGLFSYFSSGQAASGDSVTLEATARDTVWISITSDGKRSEQVTLLPQQSKRWSAAEKFVLSVGNAGGVTLYRNGTSLPPLGAIGETVRSIRISKSEFITSASPWKSQRDTTKKSPQKPKPVTPSVIQQKQPNTAAAPKPQPITRQQPSSTVPKPTAQQQLARPQQQTFPPTRTTVPATQSQRSVSTPPSNASQGRPQPVTPARTTQPNSSTTTEPKPTATTATIPKPKTAAQREAEAEAKRRREEIIRRARQQTEITTVPLKTQSDSKKENP